MYRCRTLQVFNKELSFPVCEPAVTGKTRVTENTMTSCEQTAAKNAAEPAYTMPVHYYLDPAVFKRETERMFSQSWIAVAAMSDVGQANDFATVTVAGDEILLVRGRDDVLRGFYNVCPHRAHELMKGCGKAKNVITCPYHAWTFGLDGQIIRARNCENVDAFNLDEANLTPVQVEEFCGLVYVNLDLKAPSLRAQAPGLEASITSRLPGVDRLIRAKDHRIPHYTKSNWKAIVDNYLECYHCQPAHPGFVDSVDLKQYRHELHGLWTVQIGAAKASAKGYGVATGAGNPEFAGYYLWPTVMMNITPGDVGMMTVNTMVPINQELTLQYYDFYLPTAEPTPAQMAVIAFYRDVFRAEDIGLVESVQRGMKSRGFRGQGRIMTDQARSGISEHGIAHFHQQVVDVLRE